MLRYEMKKLETVNIHQLGLDGRKWGEKLRGNNSCINKEMIQWHVSCVKRRVRRRRKRRRERGFEWNAFRIMRHVRIPRVRLRGNEGNGEQVGSRVSPSERFAVREMRRRLFRKVPRCCLSPSSSPLSPSPYQDKLILMPDTVVDVRAHSAWISATDDYLSRDNGTMVRARLVCCTMRKMHAFVARPSRFCLGPFQWDWRIINCASSLLGWQLGDR